MLSRRDAVINKMKEILSGNPNLGRRTLSRMINDSGIPTSAWEVRKLLQAEFGRTPVPTGYSTEQPSYEPITQAYEPSIRQTGPSLDMRVLNVLKKGPINIPDLKEITHLEYVEVLLGIANLRAEGRNIEISNDAEMIVSMRKDMETGGTHVIDVSNLRNEPYKFGWVSDTHLCSKFSRLDVLNALYDIFEREGIKDVYHGGNYIDGEAKFNMYDLLVHGITGQLNYFIDNYPQRPGITTHFIAGDDHEGWYAQREGINIGKYTEQQAVSAGRNDLHYLGYMEADVALKAKNGESVMRVMHGGGGTGYATSYRSQKQVESLEGGEKPQVILLSHYHKFDYLYPRGVHVVQTGTTQSQSSFMRKKNLEAHVGGGISWIRMADNGSVTSFRVEWIPFYDRKFYENNFDRF